MRAAITALLLTACGTAAVPGDGHGCQTAEHDVFERTHMDASDRLGGCAIDSTCFLERDPTNAEWAACYEDATLARDCTELAAVVLRCER